MSWSSTLRCSARALSFTLAAAAASGGALAAISVPSNFAWLEGAEKIDSHRVRLKLKRVFPAAKELKPGQPASPAQKTALKKAMAGVVSVDL